MCLLSQNKLEMTASDCKYEYSGREFNFDPNIVNEKLIKVLVSAPLSAKNSVLSLFILVCRRGSKAIKIYNNLTITAIIAGHVRVAHARSSPPIAEFAR